MTLKFYDSPFHVTHDEEVANKMAMKLDMLEKLGYKIHFSMPSLEQASISIEKEHVEAA
jgi:hypothetical protein